MSVTLQVQNVTAASASASALPVSEVVTISLDIFTAVLDIGGIVGNVVSFGALLRCVGAAAMHIILRSLAIADCMFLFCHLVFQLASFYEIIDFTRITKCIGYTYVANAAITITVWTTVLLSIERLVAVCYPFKHHEAFSKRRTVMYIVFVWLGSFICRIPGFSQRLMQILARMEQDRNLQHWQNTTNYSRRPTESAAENVMKQLYLVLWSAEAIVSIVVVIVCNIKLLVAIFQLANHWTSMPTKHKHEVNITKVPLWVIAMFLLSEVPKKICGVLLQTNAVASSYFPALIAVCDVCTVLNSATNIVIYFACSARVRNKLNNLLSQTTTDANTLL